MRLRREVSEGCVCIGCGYGAIVPKTPGYLPLLWCGKNKLHISKAVRAGLVGCASKNKHSKGTIDMNKNKYRRR